MIKNKATTLNQNNKRNFLNNYDSSKGNHNQKNNRVNGQDH